jgi:hypothetical protein
MQFRAFANIFPSVGPSNATLGLYQSHQKDFLDPFIASSQVSFSFSFTSPFIF